MNQLALPEHLRRFQSRDLGQTLSQNLGANAPPYVSIASGRFTLIDAAGNKAPVGTFDPQLGVYLDAVIIDVNDHLSRIFYANEYDPSAQNFLPPDCWSDNGVGPSTACSNPQARTCTPDPDGVYGCKWAVWGSALSAQGKQIPACQQVQKVALLVPSHPQAVFLLRVPPNSHKNLRSYNEKSKGSGVDISNVVTRIYFDATTQGTLLFSGVSWIDEGIAQAREAAYTEKKTDAIVGRNDVARQAGAGIGYDKPPAVQITHQSNQAPGMGDLNRPMPAPQVATFIGQPGNVPVQLPLAPAPQVQQPAPFVQTATPAVQTGTGAVSATQPANVPTGAPQRRRRRTAAEIAQANAAPQAAQPDPMQQQAVQPATAGPTAPFPHPGQVAGQAATTQPTWADLGFGMSAGQPAGANPEVAAALDSFFQT